MSQINLYKNCPGAGGLISQMGDGELSESQEEGILAHATVFALAKKEEPPIGATLEMIEHATAYLTSLEPLLANPDIFKEFESPVTLYIEHDRVVSGIADFIAYDEENRLVIVHEYKYGHVPVNAEYDLQTVIYASAAYPMAEKVIVSIEQPRSFGETKSIKVYEGEGYRKIQIFARGVMFDAAQENAALRTGAHCANCPVRFNCPALREKVLQLTTAVESYTMNLAQDTEKTAQELSFLSRIKELLDIRINAIKDDFTQRITRGERVPGYLIKNASTRLEWSVGLATLYELEKRYCLSLLKKPEPITPLQALKKGLPEQVLVENTLRKTGSMKLYEITKDEIAKKLGVGT